MKIFYLISLLTLFISYLMIQTTKEKKDILKKLALNFVLLFCYNAFVCYVLTLLSVQITLLSLGIINSFFSILIIIYLCKTKKIQKFELEKIDIIYWLIIAIVVVFIALINFGFPLQIKYATGDPSVHYLSSQMFAEDDSLLAMTEHPDVVYGKLGTMKTVSYVNSGILMKCFEGIIDSFDFYNIFICFGIFVFLLSGWMFYCIISNFCKSEKRRFLAFVFSLLYLLGYPLNSFLFGFEYFSMGILILEAIIGAVSEYQKNQISFKHNLLIFFLLNFGLFTSYYMFVPYVYSALWIYFCITEYKRTKKIISFKTCILLFVTLLLPFGLGYIYYIESNIYVAICLAIRKIFNLGDSNTQSNIPTNFNVASSFISSGLARYGYMYTNFFSNMILLLPFSFIAIYKKWEEDKSVIFMTLFNVLFIILLLFGSIFGKVSYYYLSKNYFPLWLFLYYLSFKGFLVVFEKNKIVPSLCVAVYVTTIIIASAFYNEHIDNIIPNKHEKIYQVVDIYQTNKILLMNMGRDLYEPEIEILKYVKDNIPEDKKIEVAGTMEQGFWTYAMLRRINKDVEKGGQELLENKMLYVFERAGKVDYLIYFNEGKYYNKYKELLVKNAEVVFENEAGGVLKYIK